MSGPFEKVSKGVMRLLVDAVEKHLGMRCDRSVLRGGLRAMEQIASSSGYASVEEFLLWLLRKATEKDRLDCLARCFTVGETYFFRNIGVFLAIRNVLIPEILERKDAVGLDRHIRIWSAGCSTGEEPYTLAMVLERARQGGADWNYSICATDINEGFLAVARKGSYRPWSFRKPIPNEYRKYFICREAEYEVVPEIRNLVSFSVLNLVEDGYPSAVTGTSRLDIIICRNVIMYLLPQHRQVVVERFQRCLTEGGFLILTPAELHTVNMWGWKKSVISGGVVLQKVTVSEKKCEGAGKSLPALHQAGDQPGRYGASQELLDDSLRPSTVESGSWQSRKILVKDTSLHGGTDEGSRRLSKRWKGEAKGSSSSLTDLNKLAKEIHEMANSGRCKEALELIDQCLEKEGFRSEFFYFKGAIFEEMRQSEEALSAYRRAVYLDPHSIPALIALGSLLMAQGNRVAGGNFLREALRALKDREGEEILLFGEIVPATDLANMVESFLEKEER